MTPNINNFFVYVSYDTSQVDYRKAEEQYGDWYEQNEFTIEEVSYGRDEGGIYKDEMRVDFNPAETTEVYVLYGIYSTGDSFGYSEGNGHIIGIYDTYERAQSIQKIIQNIYDLYKARTSIKDLIVNPDVIEWCRINNIKPKDFSPYSVAPWHGYFEGLSDLVISKQKLKYKK